MKKKLLGSFKKLFGLKVSDSMCKIWLKYFTGDLPKAYNSIPASSNMSQAMKDFTIQGIPEKVIYGQAKEIEADPVNFLPKLFNFEQRVSPQYFQFCSLLLSSSVKKGVIANDVFPHIMRVAIVFDYVLRLSFDKLLMNTPHDLLPLSYVREFGNVVRVAMLSESPNVPEFMSVFCSTLTFIEMNLSVIINKPNDFAIVKLVSDVLSIATSYFVETSTIAPAFTPLISFMALYVSLNVTAGKFSNEMKVMIEKGASAITTKMKATEITEAEATVPLVAMIAHLFFMFSKQKTETIIDYVPMCINLIQFLVQMSPLKLVDVKPPFVSVDYDLLARGIASFLRSAFTAYFPQQATLIEPGMEVREGELEHKVFDFTEVHYINDVADERKVREEEQREAIVPSIFNENQYMLLLFKKIRTFTEKDKDFSYSLMKMTLESMSSTILSQYFSVSVLLLGDSTFVASMINDHKMWPKLLTAATFAPVNELSMKTELNNMMNMLMYSSFTSYFTDQSLLLHSLSEHLDSKFALQVAVMLFKLLVAAPNKFIESLKQTNLLDVMLQYDGKARATLMTDNNQEDLKTVRSWILAFICKLGSYSAGCTQLIGPKERRSYLFSLLYELCIQDRVMSVIGSGIKIPGIAEILVEDINDLMCMSLNYLNDPKWEEMVIKLLVCIENGANVPVCRAFLKVSGINTIHKIASSSENQDFALRILSFISTLCYASNEFVREVRKPQWQFRETWEQILKRRKLTDNVMSILTKLIYLDETKRFIRNAEGLNLMLSMTRGTPYQEAGILQTIEAANESSMNLYQCSQAGVIDHMLSIVNETPDDHAFELLQLVGSAYFTKNNLNIFLKAMENTSSPASLRLTEIFAEIVKQSPITTPPSFFYVDGKDWFRMESFTAPHKLGISLQIYFSKSTDKDGEFLRIWNDTQTIIVKLVCGFITIVSGHGHTTKVESRFEQNKWHNIRIDFHRRKVDLFREGVVIATGMYPKAFDLNPREVTMKIGGLGCLIENVKILEAGNVTGCYTAGVIKDEICPCTFSQKESYKDVKFDGFVVPSTLRVVNVISMSGGPRVLLPLFAVAKNHANAPKYFVNLLNCILSIAKTTDLLISQSFFRCLSQTMMNSPAVDRTAVEIILSIYNAITDNDIRREILVHILCKWQIFNADVFYHVISKILPVIVTIDPELFTATFSIKWLILAFYPYRGSSLQVINDFWLLIEKTAKQKITEDDADCVLACAIDVAYSEWAIGALNMLSRCVSKDETLKAVICQRGVYNPFFPILKSPEEAIQLKGLAMLYHISNIFPVHPLSMQATMCMNSYQLNYITEKTVDQLMAYVYAIVQSGHSIDSQKISGDLSIPNPIKNGQFIPLLCFVMHKASNARERAELLRESIMKFESSLQAIVQCTNWPFWILFLSTFDGNWLEWIDAVAKITVFNLRNAKAITVTEIYAYIYVMAMLLGESYDDAISRFMTSFTTDKGLTQETLPEFIKFIYFMPEKKYPVNDLKEDRCVLSKFAKKVISIDRLETVTFGFTQGLIINENEATTKAKVEYAVRYVHFLLDNITQYAGGVIRLVNDNVSIPPLIVLGIHFLTVGGSPEGRSLLEKFMSEATFGYSRRLLSILRDDFKDDPELYELLKTTTGDDSDRIDVVKMFGEQSEKYDNLFNETVRQVFERLKYLCMRLFDRVELLGDNLHIDADDCRKSIERLIRQDEFFWASIENELMRYGAVWSDTEQSQHWKIDRRLDSLGRRMKMKINNRYSDHKDAANYEGSETTEVIAVERSISSFLTEETKIERTVLLQFPCQLVTVTTYFKGTMYFTNTSVIFEANEISDPLNSSESKKAQKMVEIETPDVKMVLQRKYLHKDIASEVFTKSGKSYFFVFSPADRKSFLMQMNKVETAVVQLKSPQKLFKDLGIQKDWLSGKISNYEYLYWLNIFSGRSFNDIAQYPVFPWVLSNYTSPELNLADPSMYRDLSLPIGALNPDRLEKLEVLYEEIKDLPIACLYRFHYSTPAYVIHYLLRCEPFTSLHIALQSGKFDHASRLFSSLPDSWGSVVGENSDFREVIPEFYSTPEFLINTERFPLGRGVDDVVLPTWCQNASEFICMNRNALESDIVSSKLHLWIDLIFGCKQQNMEAKNLFHPYTDSKSIIDNPDEQAVIEHYAANFGIIPEMLFSDPHPQRAFHPVSFNFDSLFIMNFESIGKIEKILRIWTEDSDLFMLHYPGKIRKTNISVFSPKTVSQFKLDFPEALSMGHVFAERSSVVSEGQFVVSNPWYEGFQVFNIKESSGSILYKRDKNVVRVNSLSAAAGIVVTGGEDSSLIVWDLYRGIIIKSICSHSHPIKLVRYNGFLDLIVSVDMNGSVAYSSAGSQAVRSMTKQNVTDVCIGQCGIVIVVSESRNLGDVTTILEAYDLGQRLLCDCRIPGSIEASCVCTLGDRSEYLCVCMSTRKVYLLRFFDLRRMCAGEVHDRVTSCAFSTESTRLYLSTSTDLLQCCFN